MCGDVWRFFVLDVSGDSWNMLFKHFCSISLEGCMISVDFCVFVPKLVKIGELLGKGRGHGGTQKKDQFGSDSRGDLRSPGYRSGIARASLRHR